MLVDLETALGLAGPGDPAFGCAGWVDPGHAATRDIINAQLSLPRPARRCAATLSMAPAPEDL
jgi:hypothetical protein